jgi:hypothetical protein
VNTGNTDIQNASCLLKAATHWDESKTICSSTDLRQPSGAFLEWRPDHPNSLRNHATADP